ncbi:predicted protein [Nematostella vectensis]|uniref:F5/8 type C domain-containing protein n=1 Tax=Nematostella vectensis TaxID=45351 RepID=A7SXY6_NEMVE|nr:predicted protein [Nematostella vectensis]|eukprot:XP_001623534.1 predicted protein [Nematostella vectensis]
MEDGRIQDTSITASSTYSSPGHNPHHARLNNQPVKEKHIGAWGAADLQTKGEYLQVDLGRVTWITHVATQGRPIEHAQWVTEYSVEYSLTGEQWQSYLDGNGVIKMSLSRESIKYCRVTMPFCCIRMYTRSAMGKPGSETALEKLMSRFLCDLLQEGVVPKLADDAPKELLNNWKRVLSALQKKNVFAFPRPRHALT